MSRVVMTWGAMVLVACGTDPASGAWWQEVTTEPVEVVEDGGDDGDGDDVQEDETTWELGTAASGDEAFMAAVAMRGGVWCEAWSEARVAAADPCPDCTHAFTFTPGAFEFEGDDTSACEELAGSARVTTVGLLPVGDDEGAAMVLQDGAWTERGEGFEEQEDGETLLFFELWVD